MKKEKVYIKKLDYANTGWAIFFESNGEAVSVGFHSYADAKFHADDCNFIVIPQPKDESKEVKEGGELLQQLNIESDINYMLRQENEKIKRLLHDLTPGGSEFYNDPEYCAKWIRENREGNHYTLAELIKRLKAEKTIMAEALRRIKSTYDNVEDLAGVIAKEALSKVNY